MKLKDEDLKEYGKGYSRANLFYMKQFANEIDKNEIIQQPAGQIPLGTLVTVIMTKSKLHEEMLYYINETYKKGLHFGKIFSTFLKYFLIFLKKVTLITI